MNADDSLLLEYPFKVTDVNFWSELLSDVQSLFPSDNPI